MSHDVERRRGTILANYHRKGYGFVLDAVTNQTYFFHVTDVIDRKVLQRDQAVTFSIGIGTKGREKALKIAVYEAAEPAITKTYVSNEKDTDYVNRTASTTAV